jgi:hypothetical protein
LELDKWWYLLCPFCIPGNLPWIHHVPLLEVNLENMDTTASKIISLASKCGQVTVERLARHGLQHHTRCPLCNQAPETMRHLMLKCPFTRTAWHEVLAWLKMIARAPNGEDSLMDW